jgi:hypothetical protein
MNAHFEKKLKEIIGDSNIKGTDVPLVFVVKGNIISNISGKFESKKRSLVDELRQQHPYAHLWLTSWSEELLKKVQTSGWKNVSNNLWLIPREEKTEEFQRHAYEGAWGLLFCDQPFSTTSTLDYLPSKPSEIKTFLDSSNALALIISWFDDAEWIIGYKAKSTPE